MKPATRLIVSVVALILLAFQPRLAGQATASLTILHTFTGGTGDGSLPYAGLIQGSDGNFYGTTSQGGSANNYGTVFRITPAGAISILHHFASSTADGSLPYAGLIQGSDGNFYGTTVEGGGSGNSGSGYGTVFRITPGGAITILHHFTGDGSFPYAALVQGGDGNFYGTTESDSSGGGTVFRITSAGALTTLYNFPSNALDVEGNHPRASLVEGSDGSFYGTNFEGGGGVEDPVSQNTDGHRLASMRPQRHIGTGTIFQITPAGALTVLHHFMDGSDGKSPYAGLVQGRDGNFYGTASSGGSSNGTVFRITPSGTHTVLHTFTGGTGDGSSPRAVLVRGKDGNFYGTTYSGGSSGNFGTVFQITPAGAITILHHFAGGTGDGSAPQAGLVEGSDGRFYGTTVTGGSSGSLGTVFQLTVSPTITTATNASGTVGVAFSYQIAATNGPTSFGAAGLPDGLAVNTATGRISGTPTQVGTYTVTLYAYNPGGTGTATLTLTINPVTPIITSDAPPGGQISVAYNFQIAASNDPASFAADGLPPGLAIDTTTGQITGTPTQAGTFTVNVTATNAGGTSSPKSYSLTILPAVPVITSPGSASGQVGQPFSYQITATNNPTIFGVLGLGDGLSVDGSGKITGTPTAAKSFNLTLNASNGGGKGSATLTVTITTAPPPVVPQITSAAGDTAQAGQAYQFPITATNNPTGFASDPSPPFQYQDQNGNNQSLGLTLDPSTGVITGTPTTAGKFTAALTAHNANGTGPTATFTLNVSAAPSGIYGFEFSSPPSQSQLVRSATVSTVPIYVQVLHSPGTLASLVLYADDSATGTSTNIGSALNTDITEFGFNWTLPTVSAADAFTLRAVATDTSNPPRTSTFTLPVTVVPPPSDNPVSSIKLLPDLGTRQFIPGTTVTLVPVAGDADTPIKTVGVYEASGARFGGLAATPRFTDPKDKTRVFPPINYPVRPGIATLTATVTNVNDQVGDLSNPSLAVSINPAPSAQVDQTTLTCQITAPAANAQGNAVAAAGQPVTFTASAKRKNGSAASMVEYYVDGKLVGSNTNAPFSVTVDSLAAGTHTLTAIATDANLSVSRQADPVTLTAKPVPVITSDTTASATTGVAFSYKITANNSPTQFGVLGLPAGLKVNADTGMISGAPQHAGTFKLTLNAFNTVGKGSVVLTLTVAKGVPVITSATTATATRGQAFSYQIVASGDPTSYGVLGLPPGLHVDAKTGLVSGTPTTAGMKNLTLKAANSVGTGQQTLTLTIN